MRRVSQAVVTAVAFLVLCPQASHAQALSELLSRFFTPANPLVLANPQHAAHFVARPNSAFTQTVSSLNRNIAYQLSSFPTGSSSGGFTFQLDETLGTLTRTTESFGPLFAERALTSGKNKLTLGGTYVHATYDRFEGKDLDDGSIQLTLTHIDIPTIESHFEGDLIDSDLLLDLRTDTFAMFATYGVTDRFDVGVAVPFQQVKMDATFRLSVLPVATQGDAVPSHFFQGGGLTTELSDSGEASGIGDVVLRGKLNFLQADWGGLALGVDVKLPTGDAENLLGTGSTQVKSFFIASGGKSRFSPHVNAGYTFTSESDTLGDLPDEINYAAGFDAALSSRLTLTADVVGRALLDAQRLTTTETTYRYRTASDPPGAFPRVVTREEFATETGTLNLLLGSVGFKLNPTGRLLIAANVLFSLSKDNGLQDDITPVIEFDYNF
jgi:hypothetical protein